MSKNKSQGNPNSLFGRIKSNKVFLGGIIGAFLVLIVVGLIFLGFYFGVSNISEGESETEATLVAIAAFQTIQADENNIQIEDETPLADDNNAITEEQSVVSDTPSTESTLCNQAEFVSDVSIPDDSILEPGENFTKTWRILNTSDCVWTTEYHFIFSGGAKMGAQLEIALPYEVLPNDTVDISLDMTAPQNAGVYRSDWLIRDDSGNEFGIQGLRVFYVRIIVEESGTDIEITFNEKGSVASLGMLYDLAISGEIDDWQMHAFIRFNLSSIPSGATINQAYFHFYDYEEVGKPFEDLGCLEIYEGDFFPLSVTDFNSHTSYSKVAEYCEYSELQNSLTTEHLVEAIQFFHPSYIDFLLLFDGVTDYVDDDSDTLQFVDIRLEINYTEP